MVRATKIYHGGSGLWKGTSKLLSGISEPEISSERKLRIALLGGPATQLQVILLEPDEEVFHIPDRIVPLLEAAPASQARVATYLLGQYLPENTAFEYEQDPSKRGTVADAWFADFRLRWFLRQERFDESAPGSPLMAGFGVLPPYEGQDFVKRTKGA